MCDLVRCGVVSHPAQELGPRTSSLCSLLSACDVNRSETGQQRVRNRSETGQKQPVRIVVVVVVVMVVEVIE